MKQKTFTAIITPLSDQCSEEPEQVKGCSPGDDPISFAEDIHRSLPTGRYLISVRDSQWQWECETRLAPTWRDGVPIRSIVATRRF